MTGACADKRQSIGPAYVAQSNYEAWSCDQLVQEIARSDTAFTNDQKTAAEKAMIYKSCIRPLAAETE